MWEMINNSGNYTSSLELEAGYLEGVCADTEPCALSKLRSIQDGCSCSDSVMGCCRASLSGMMCKHLTEPSGGDKSMSCAEDSHAKTYQAPTTKRKGSRGNGAGSGLKCDESSVRYDLATCSWKTHQDLLIEDLHWSSVTLPTSGMIVRGGLSAVTKLEEGAEETGYGLWPRPCRAEAFGGINQTGSVTRIRNLVDSGQIEYEEAIRITRGQLHKKNLKPWREHEHNVWLTLHGKKYSGEKIGTLHPSLYEWVLRWPIGWTELLPLGMDKILSWRHMHGQH